MNLGSLAPDFVLLVTRPYYFTIYKEINSRYIKSLAMKIKTLQMYKKSKNNIFKTVRQGINKTGKKCKL